MADIILTNPADLNLIITDLQDRLKDADYSDPLGESQQDIAEFEAGMFAGGFDSNLVDWPPLKPSTIKRKGNDRILVETGALMASLVSVGGPGNINAVESRGMLFGTDVEYAIFHQDGTSRMPARPPVGMAEDTLKKLTDGIADSAVDQLKLT